MVSETIISIYFTIGMIIAAIFLIKEYKDINRKDFIYNTPLMFMQFILIATFYPAILFLGVGHMGVE